MKFTRREAVFCSLAISGGAALPFIVPDGAKEAGIDHFFDCAEITQLAEPPDDQVAMPLDWKLWPQSYLDGAAAALEEWMKQHPANATIVYDRWNVSQRTDLSGLPWQLHRMVKIKIPV